MDSTRFWGLEVEWTKQEHVMICDDAWHNMNPRDCFTMEYYEPMIDEEKTSRSTSSLDLPTPYTNRRTEKPLEINSWRSAWAWLGTEKGICPSLKC